MSALEDRTWQEWSDRLWDSMEERFGYPGLAHLEQKMYRSRKETRCVECGDPGTVKQTSVIVASVPFYWFCDECDDYWKHKHD